MAERARRPGSGDGWPPRHIPITPPGEVNGFRFVALVNGFDDQERPRPWPGRPWVSEAGERERLLGYLRSGAHLFRTDEFTYDIFDPMNPARRWAVPVSYLTDGVWIWSEASAYYLRHHHLAPPPAFYEHIEAQGYRCPVGPEPDRLAAREALFERGRIHKSLRDDYDRRQYLETTPFTLVRGELSNEPPTIAVDPDRLDELDTRFPHAVLLPLLDAGWLPGRDAAERVDPWLAASGAQTVDPLDRHEIFPAARDIYREFGLLDIYPHGWGEKFAACPIHFFPEDGPEAEVAAHRLPGLPGVRAFPIGRTEDSINVLTVDEEGRVYMDHDVAGWLFLGTSIDAALEVLVRGLKAPTLRSRIDDLRSGRLPGTRREH